MANSSWWLQGILENHSRKINGEYFLGEIVWLITIFNLQSHEKVEFESKPKSLLTYGSYAYYLTLTLNCDFLHIIFDRFMAIYIYFFQFLFSLGQAAQFSTAAEVSIEGK